MLPRFGRYLGRPAADESSAAADCDKQHRETLRKPMSDDMHFYDPATGHGLRHDPFKAIVAPRMIGWISSRARPSEPCTL
jgi:hypothetical protein